MRQAALAAKAGNRLLGIVAGLLILVMLLYGAYSLWDTAMVYAGAFSGRRSSQIQAHRRGGGQPYAG